MRGFMLGLSLSLAFILGCLMGPFLVPPISAQPPVPAAMQRWEYLAVGTGAMRESRATANLNEFGVQGWELVHVNGESGRAYFKRPAR
ncbi:MAG: hypothetical protein AAGH15_28110 [Myxococcota bacterium]